MGLHIGQEHAAGGFAVDGRHIDDAGRFPVAVVSRTGIRLTVGSGHRGAIDLEPALTQGLPGDGIGGTSVHLPNRGLLLGEVARSHRAIFLGIDETIFRPGDAVWVANDRGAESSLLIGINDAVFGDAKSSIPGGDLTVTVIDHGQVGAIAGADQAPAIEGIAEVEGDQVAEGVGATKFAVAGGGEHQLLAIVGIDVGILQAAQLQGAKIGGGGPQLCLSHRGNLGAAAHQHPATSRGCAEGQGIEISGVGHACRAGAGANAAAGGHPGVEVALIRRQAIALEEVGTL